MVEEFSEPPRGSDGDVGDEDAGGDHAGLEDAGGDHAGLENASDEDAGGEDGGLDFDELEFDGLDFDDLGFDAPGPTAATERGPIAGRFTVTEPLGESRLGWIHRGRDGETGEDVEITFLHAATVAAAADVEARLEELSNLAHLHVLALLHWELHPVPCLVYPTPTVRLQHFISAGVALSPSQTLLIGLQAAETLHALGRQGITHGALTPWHCCVDARGRLQLAGMGLELLRQPVDAGVRSRYAAPGPSEAGADDAFGLGLALAEIAAGRPVERSEIPQLGSELVPEGAGAATARHLSQLAPLLVQATATMPQHRLDAGELALGLRATAEMMPPPARLDEAFGHVAERAPEVAPVLESAPVRATPAGAPRRAMLRLIAAAAVVVAAGLVLLSTTGRSGTSAHTVPDVVGTSWEQADGTLRGAGWEVRLLEVRVAGADAGEVIGQLPEPGGLLDEGEVVKVQVSLGEPLVVIPANIVGVPLEVAGLRLSAIGLGVGSVRERNEPSVPAGTVLAVAGPLPELPRGSTVDLVVAADR